MQNSFAVKSYTLHLNRSASDPLICYTIKLQNFRPLNALISSPAEAIGPTIHEGKEGEQHAEDLGLMHSLRGGARSTFAERFKCKKGRTGRTPSKRERRCAFTALEYNSGASRSGLRCRDALQTKEANSDDNMSKHDQGDQKCGQ
jgi:hypothetical protein